MSDQTHLVIGGTSGIGAALVAHLAGNGHQVIRTGRGEAADGPDSVRHIVWDAADPFPEQALPERLDGLAYCPGTIRLAPFNRMKDEDFLEDLEINLMGAVRALRGAQKVLSATSGSSVVVFSSVAVTTGMPFHASVAAAKGALEGLTRALAAELAPDVRVNALALSLTDTPLAKRLLASEAKRQAAAGRHPLQQVGAPEGVARLAATLMEDRNGWVTGQVIVADGGLSGLRLFA